LVQLDRIADEFKVTEPDRFRLAGIDSRSDGGVKSKEEAAELLAKSVERLKELQERLYAEDRWSLLVIFQAMDAAGKDSTIKHVMSGVNPQGCQVYSFKAPSSEELDHDFLWRAVKCLPERGKIGIFNRSYYEEMLVVRVHPELLKKQKLAPELMGPQIWQHRFETVNAFERHLTKNGIAICKFFLHVSYEEQRERFLARLEEPSKNWKFSMNDVLERKHWPDYMNAFEDMIRNTSTEYAPWHVIPADKKWFSRLAVSSAIVKAIEEIDPQFPTVDVTQLDELKAARAALEAESKPG
jgi:PPK2 family polyphosphate:nucleotide phosphotransferase